MVQPQRAPVKPRVLSPGGEALPLEDEVRSFLDVHRTGIIHLTGPAGSGKTTALRHLAAVLPPNAAMFLDEGPPGKVSDSAGPLVIYASRNAWPGKCLASYVMAPWAEDECIEYLLAVHRPRCGSVVQRLRAAGRRLLPPLPDVGRVVLDEMAADESVGTVGQALQRFIARQVAGPNVEQALRLGCLRLLLPVGSHPHLPEKEQPVCGPALWRLLRHEAIQLLLAAEQIVADLRERSPCRYLKCALPRPLVQETAARAVQVPEAVEHLRHLFAEGPVFMQAMTASILHATDTGWVPSGERLNLEGAYLADAAWPYVPLPEANLKRADLSGAYLHEAVLDRAAADGIDLAQGRLAGASLRGFFAVGANLAGADLSLARAEKAVFHEANLKGANLEGAVLRGASFAGACLEGACLAEADLSGAVLKAVDLTGADFTAANLEEATLAKLCLRKGTFTGARFARASLVESDLEYLQLPAADFNLANLTGACLTASWMPEANFENACLRGAGLADINWAGACLRGADLTGASFHAGSSRSGLVFSPIACEGSRTGFYTDDSDEQYFKCPEEVRKANLCGADLRGAVLTHVDFYLVDLRGALFDPGQEQHFRRCRAILEARV
jgi:uncharacterized protein YjbI with pentapeptide repeats/energy-coupling factor transporter ATP-binding protein EcfA2